MRIGWYDETTEVQNPYTREKTLRFLLDIYFSLGGKKKSIDIDSIEETIDENTIRIFQEYGFWEILEISLQDNGLVCHIIMNSIFF